MKKNDEYTIEITDMSTDGEGVGHVEADGMRLAVFVKDAVLGDVAKVKLTKLKKNYAFGRLMKVITPGPDRVEPLCPIAAKCGGCSMMQLSYEKQLELKSKRVTDVLKRIGGVDEPEKYFEGVTGMEQPYHFRNKMQFPVGLDRDGKVLIGFYAGRTHSIMDSDSCATGHPVNDYIIRHIRPWIEKNQRGTGSFVYDEEEHKGLIRHLLTRTGFTTGELMVCLVINGSKLAKAPEKAREIEAELVAELTNAVDEYNTSGNTCPNAKHEKVLLTSVQLNTNTEKTNRILGEETRTVFGKDYIEDVLLGNTFRISALSFYQVNPVQTERIYSKALEYAGLTGSETVWDMYCGAGTISLSLAKQAGRVYGVEIVEQAIEDAKKNAEANFITNAEFYAGDAGEVVSRIYASGKPGSRADVVVVDPPRQGLSQQLIDTVAAMSPERIVYVSCDPATLARDIKLFSEKGYEINKAAAFDAFCHSNHVETVVAIQRVKS